MITGIYTITNIINNKMYVGKTKNFQKRKNEHFLALRKNIHNNQYLQNAVNKYGIENFKIEILEECNEYYLHSQEHYWCNMLNVLNKDFGYNIQYTNPQLNKHILSQESKDKIGLANKGKSRNKGYEHSLEFKEKVSKNSSNRSQFTKNKISKTLSEIPHIILQYDLNGNFIKKWFNALIASKELSITHSNIIRCVNNQRKTAGKFKWIKENITNI